jgi:hypothetical protein
LGIAVAASIRAILIDIYKILAPVPEIHVVELDYERIYPWIGFMHSFPSSDLIVSFIIFDIYRGNLRAKNHRLFPSNRYMLKAEVIG